MLHTGVIVKLIPLRGSKLNAVVFFSNEMNKLYLSVSPKNWYTEGQAALFLDAGSLVPLEWTSITKENKHLKLNDHGYYIVKKRKFFGVVSEGLLFDLKEATQCLKDSCYEELMYAFDSAVNNGMCDGDDPCDECEC